MKHCYTAVGFLCLSNQEKITTKFAVQVCGSKKLLAVAEVQKITANVPQTCGFAVADRHCHFAELAVAEYSVNLRCPALGIYLKTAPGCK